MLLLRQVERTTRSICLKWGEEILLHRQGERTTLSILQYNYKEQQDGVYNMQ
jgi:hypothetical protein